MAHLSSLGWGLVGIGELFYQQDRVVLYLKMGNCLLLSQPPRHTGTISSKLSCQTIFSKILIIDGLWRPAGRQFDSVGLAVELLGLEPFDERRKDWQIRYFSRFQIGKTA